MKGGISKLATIAALTALAGAVALAQAVMVDTKIADYKKTSGVSGSLSSVGSDTLNNLMTLWNEGFRDEYPNVKVQVEGKGSSTAPRSCRGSSRSSEIAGVSAA